MWNNFMRRFLYILLVIISSNSIFPYMASGAEQGMVLIPAGEFIMGASEEDGAVGIEVGVDVMPRRKVYLKAFYIDRYETTNIEYKEFLAANPIRPPLLWGPYYAPKYPPIRDNDPISDINWDEADKYCRWKGKRLPTEEEWEKAARGVDGRKFPWGNEWKEDIANTTEYSSKQQTIEDSKAHRYTYTVGLPGSFKHDLSPYGVYDMAGNVMEWTSSWYNAYPGSKLKRELFGEKVKVLKGGSWMAEAIPFSATFSRHFAMPNVEDPHFGVRCAKDGEQAEDKDDFIHLRKL